MVRGLILECWMVPKNEGIVLSDTCQKVPCSRTDGSIKTGLDPALVYMVKTTIHGITDSLYKNAPLFARPPRPNKSSDRNMYKGDIFRLTIVCYVLKGF